MLQDEIGFAGISVLVCRGIGFHSIGPGFQEAAGGTRSSVSGVPQPIEYVLNAVPMADEGCGFFLGTLRDLADLIADLDRVLTNHAWLADLTMAKTNRPGFAKTQSPQVIPTFHTRV